MTDGFAIVNAKVLHVIPLELIGSEARLARGNPHESHKQHEFVV